jgi:hypothetical protein
MAFADGDTTKTQIHETLKLLHETIQKQIEATDKQSNIMVWLTIGLFVLAIVQVLLLLFQICPNFFL